MLTFDEAAAFLKVSRHTTNNYMKKGEFIYHRLGRRVYFSKKEILDSMKLRLKSWEFLKSKNKIRF